MARAFVKKTAYLVYLYSGYVQMRNWLRRLRKESHITILAYHRVADDPEDVNAVSPAIFESQIAFLKNNYRVITVYELLALLGRGENTEPSVVITFDDGYRDNHEQALPILVKYGLTACFFISSGFIGTDLPFPHDLERLGRGVPAMTWDEVRDLSAKQMEIGSHTVNHVRLSECDDGTLALELTLSRESIEKQTGREIRYFSFPFGKASDYSDAVVQGIQTAGYLCNFSAFGGVNLPAQDPFHLKRQGVSNHPSLLFFRAWVEGWRVKVRSY